MRAVAAVLIFLSLQAAYAESSMVLELEDFLHVQSPPPLPAFNGALHVVWIPAPIKKFCMGKTTEQCIQIDSCVRSKKIEDADCKKLDLKSEDMTGYAPDVRPRRLLSKVYFRASKFKGFDNLVKFFDSRKTEELKMLSSVLRFKGKMKMIRTADDDEFDLLEVKELPK